MRNVERRIFLKALVVTGFLTGLGEITYEIISKAENSTDTNVYNGRIIVQKGVNVRKSPEIPDPGKASNIIEWESITKINGIDVCELREFTVTYPLIVNGKDPDGSKTQSPWVKLKGEVENFSGIKRELDLYISISCQTSEFLQKEFFYDSQDQKIPANEIGKISVPNK